jgi:hypothetical protein
VHLFGFCCPAPWNRVAEQVEQMVFIEALRSTRFRMIFPFSMIFFTEGENSAKGLLLRPGMAVCHGDVKRRLQGWGMEHYSFCRIADLRGPVMSLCVRIESLIFPLQRCLLDLTVP